MPAQQRARSPWTRTLTLAVSAGLLFGVSACAAEPLTEAQVEAARDDLSHVYDSECYASYESAALPDCVLTNEDEEFDVYLVGDSHAAHWVPAFEEVAEEHDWRLTFHGKRSCSFSINEQSDNQGNDYPSCEEWNEDLQQKILQDRPDVVITSNYSRNYVMDGETILERGPGTPGEAALAAGMVDAWEPVLDADIDLILMQDTPKLSHDVPDCLLENLSAPEACDADYAEAVENLPQPELIAAEQLPEAEVLNLNDEICTESGDCSAVQENTIVWRDSHHFTETYSQQLADELAEDLEKVPAVAGHMR